MSGQQERVIRQPVWHTPVRRAQPLAVQLKFHAQLGSGVLATHRTSRWSHIVCGRRGHLLEMSERNTLLFLTVSRCRLYVFDRSVTAPMLSLVIGPRGA